ncbi:rhodanese-like domain-containing protein [Polaribacter septentrionalilitoris]|uniref:rhodanese-like domain-containing protein n=1 Tax=Polaribacter septentrionalilitoris TaxID=2494657 RepID=UPI00135B0B79|nr:rhodanese-like domain-containing protein [Polaribacter septentrionalilitoris]
MKHLIYLFFSGCLFINCTKKQDINTITTQELKELLSKDKIQLLDVRTPIEIEQGSIESALFVNYFDTDFAMKATNKLDKTKPVYLFCRSGNRSGKAAVILKEKGFIVYNVLGGYTKWKTEN